ncbi:MAG: tetratricopeptide repeat protein [Xanthomonadales bacterium]|jgi:TolB-like protein|nr:tetratricopeptide repeat protein [Xanthomonadales bacterium]
MSFFTELKRRNVFRATLAYAVFAWLLLQVVEFVLELVGSPDWVLRVLVVLAIAGLPAVAVFSWAFEITPEGVRREKDVDRSASQRPETGQRLNQITLVSVVMLVAFLVADWFFVGDEEADKGVAHSPAAGPEVAIDASPAPDTAPAEADDRVSVAVLPFTNMSPDPDNEYFADGISEELLNVLVAIEGLRVPSRTSSFSFKGVATDIREIADALAVDHVLEGSVRKAGNQVRITAQLIDVSTDTHLWSETYDRELEDIFAIQDEIAGHIVKALKLTLDLDTPQPPTSDLEAYTLFLQGRELLRQRDAKGLLQAADLLEEATGRDPEFADAWAARSMVQIVLPGYVKEDILDYTPAARDFAERALALNPTHPEAMLALGQISNISGDNRKALLRLEAVVREHPGHSTAQLWLAIGLLEAGYLEEAFQHISRALESDPVHPTILDWYSRIAQMAGRPELAVAPAERALQLGRPQGRVGLHQHFIETGDVEDLEPYLEGESELTWGWMRRVFAVREDPSTLDDALAWVDEAQEAGAGFTAEYMRANFFTVAGTPADFFAQIEKIRPVDDTISSLVWSQLAGRHRRSAAMRDWVGTMGFESLWRERGWPDLCRPVGDDDFECD